MAAPLAKRLQIRPGQTVLTVNAPAGYAEALGELPEGARVAWIAYPKKTSGVETDMMRDRGWAAVTDDIDAVSQVAVDDTSSALRFRPVAEAGRRGERG
jgi:hypothetical protein